MDGWSEMKKVEVQRGDDCFYVGDLADIPQAAIGNEAD